MAKFDFSAPAELFPSRNRKIANKVKYRRFDRASDAIRFAVEELPEALLLGAYIEINEERLGHKDIRALYESENFPAKAVAQHACCKNSACLTIPASFYRFIALKL
jgi:Arc/MetJ-type ribon-helix-helix transcriptional regulator